MLAFALREMRISEETFWEMTPSKYYYLMRATHQVISDLSPFQDKSKERAATQKQQTKVTTIDQIPGWG